LGVSYSNGVKEWRKPMSTEKNTPYDQKKDSNPSKNDVEAESYSAEFLKTILDFLADPLFVKDENHRWVMLNRAMLDWMGRPIEELMGKSDYDLSPKEEADVFWEQDNKVFESNHAVENEETHTTSDGAHRVTLTNKVSFRLPSGQRYLVGTIRDITERKKAEKLIAKRANQLQVAFEVSQIASGIIDPQQLSQQIVDLIHSRFNLDFVGLFMVDESHKLSRIPGKWLELRAGSGEAGLKMARDRHSLRVEDGSMIGKCILKGEVQIVSSAERNENYWLPETRSELVLPMIVRSKTIGALSIQSSRENIFNQDDINTFQTLATLLSNSVENARLFQQTQKALDEMQEVQRTYVRTLFGRDKK
jgi:PAS domain S-box-containing protein